MRLFLSVLALLLLGVCPALAKPEIHINIPEYRLSLVEDGKLIKAYDIAVGTLYEQTPTGNYAIFYKEQYPTWFPGPKFEDQAPVPTGPDNPLGTRWMEFHPTFGIHGTNKGWDIQYPVSGGCIRMHDKDAQELYERVEIGTPVHIIYETMIFEEKPDGLYAKVLPDIYNRSLNTPERFTSLYAAYAIRYPGALLPPFPRPGDDIGEIPLLKIASPLNPVPQPAPALQPPPAVTPPSLTKVKPAS